ncbi:hypothetical protein GY45DRAFT_1326989 [Cubamyces sp. BRFM 1775]|nr:hypothetical protein GY45DRAFT_1326989 [Cubamyces sp. BRFM 1775]
MECTDILNSSNVYYSPSPGSYAVIRLNPVEMVRPLNDHQALLQAQAMQPKSYLVMLSMEMALPWPDQPWYRFEVEPVATNLRPEDKERGITPDMCAPISPNTSHPTGRESLKPQPEELFPYNNCYHWFDVKMADVRIRARPEKFDETNAVTLSVRTRIQMMRYWEKDASRMHANRKALESAAGSAEVRPPQGHGVVLQSVEASECRGADQRCPARPKDTEVSSVYSTLTASHSNHSNHSLDELAAMDIFSGPNDDVELVPLVDLWISELGDHLKQEDIPDPLEMYVEFDHIANIVKEARVRSYAALTAPAHTFDDNAATGPEGGSSNKRVRRRFTPVKAWGKLRTKAKRLSARIESMFRLPPCLHVWP